MRIDWPEYLRNHTDRHNLIVHLIAVPLFVGATVFLPFYLYQGEYLAVVIVVFLAVVSLAMQGRGHALEREAPRPFSGPLNFLRRWFTEQFVLFPLFVFTGRWWQQYRSAGGSWHDGG